MSQITVLIVDDHTIVRKGLQSLLEIEPRIKVLGEAGNGREAIAKTEELHPDVVLMDISMPKMNGLEACRSILKSKTDTKVLILTMHKNEEYIFQILECGASGYVLKQAAPEELVTAIRSVYEGNSYLSPSISGTVIKKYITSVNQSMKSDHFDQLTPKEREVLQLLAEGNSTKEIAGQLFISVKTVDTHRSNIMHKLELTNTVDLVKYALKKGYISLD